MTLSVVMITKNSADVVGEALRSVEGLWDELLVGDAGSNDGTVETVRRYGGTVIPQSGDNLGKRKQELVEKARGDWILVLDTDERVSEELQKEIVRLEDGKTVRCKAYKISYLNHVFGKPVYYGGENYVKVRLFRKGFGRVNQVPLHEEIETKGRVGELRGRIRHHSYRSFGQLFGKFTRYAWIASRTADRSDMVRKLLFYGPHMFWARFVKEQGYRDGWRGFVLAIAFAYLEALTYWLFFTVRSL